MKKILLSSMLLLLLGTGTAQDTRGQKPPSQDEIQKMMEETMKDMDETEKAEMMERCNL